jgi:hypothetical protein
MKHMLGRFLGRFSGLFLPLSLVAAFSSACTAQQNPVPVPGGLSARERTLAAEAFTAERLWVWQKRLNLQDWKVTVEMARTTDLRPKTLGNIHWDLEKKTAVVHVLDPADYRMPLHEMLQDMEFTVVHELIHLGFAPVLADLQRTDANRREEEHAVNHMADALLTLERGK